MVNEKGVIIDLSKVILLSKVGNQTLVSLIF